MSSGAVAEMAFIDLAFHQNEKRSDVVQFRVKLRVKKNDNLHIVLGRAVRKLLLNEETEINKSGEVEDATVDSAINRIKQVTCNGVDLSDFIDTPEVTLNELNSTTTPMFEKGLNVYLPKQDKNQTEPPKKKAKTINAFDVLTGKEVVPMQYIEYERDLDKAHNIDEQILEKIIAVFTEINLGYCRGDQEDLLKTNLNLLKNALCFVRKHWKVLFRAEHPIIPDDNDTGYGSSKLLSALIDTRNNRNKTEQISGDKIAYHMAAVSDLKWGAFNGPTFKEAIGTIKLEMMHVTSLLERHRSQLRVKGASMMQSRLHGSSSGKKRSVIAAFSLKLEGVQISDDECYYQIESARRPNRPRGQPSTFATCVRAAVDSVFARLRRSSDYTPMFLSDEEMGIDKYAVETRDSFMPSVTRAKYRQKFREELAYGIDHLTINVFGKINAGQDPDCLFVWKIPPTYNSVLHAGQVSRAINECREMIPKKVCAEFKRQFDAMLNGVTNIPAAARDALRNLLYLGDPNPDNSIADEYVDFVMNICAGEPVDESMFVDGRASNSRGGEGYNATKFDEFWKACGEVLMPDARVEERRHSNVMYTSEVHSIPTLISMATAVLQQKIDDGKLDKMPSIPSESWVSLQFSPNNAHREAASRYTSRLEIKRAVQLRTLRKEHPDGHWVRALIRYYKEWMVELKKEYNGIEFWGQDDKAKIPIGEQVHVSTGTRANNKGIVSANDENNLRAGDHDYVLGRIIPSVSLRSNIPQDMSGSFFVGDVESGYGQIFVTLRDAVFDPSEIFDHCAQLIDALKTKELKPTVLVLLTDGGPDHSLKRVQVKLALLALFRELSLDRLVVLRCAPNDSAGNPVERSMSILNLILAHSSLRRGEMPEWAEEMVKNINSMGGLRQAVEKLKAKQQEAAKKKRVLEVRYKVAFVCKQLRDMAGIETTNTEGQVDKIVSIIHSFVGITSGQSSDVAGAIVEEDGTIRIHRDEFLYLNVLSSQLESISEEASRSLQDEWEKSVKPAIDVIAERFSRLETSNRPVLVRPRVPTEKVDALHSHLKKIDNEYSPEITNKADLTKVPSITAFFERHAVITPYTVDIIKCKNHPACCDELKTPLHVQQLALQRMPTPVKDPRREGHFLRRQDALLRFDGDVSALTNLSDLPSHKTESEKGLTKTEKGKRDTKIAKELGRNIFAARSVRSFVTCYHCCKRRCIYSPSQEGYIQAQAAKALREKLESVSGRYSCGDLLFEDSDPLSKVLVQKLNLTCESQIEKGYYNNASDIRSLNLKDICIHCGELDMNETGTDAPFLLRQDQLSELGVTNGYKCFPICVDCLKVKKLKIVTTGKKDVAKAREEDARRKA